MKITIIPASTQAGKATIETLLKQHDPPQIRGVYRSITKAPAEFTDQIFFEAVHGGLDENLDLDFADSDAVLYVPPPTYDEQVDSGDHAARGAEKVKMALQRSSKVKRLVILSALGAQHSEGVGILKINHITDAILADSVPEVLIARPGWFQDNWAEALEAARSDDPFFETYFTPVDHKIVMISLSDVGKIVAARLLEAGNPLPSRPHAIALHGPRNYSMEDLQDALEQVTGKRPKIEAVEPDGLLKYFKRKLPAGKAEEVVEMTVAVNRGGLIATEMANARAQDVARGSTELVDTLHQLATGKVSKVASGAF